jgi:sugar phosphate permease
MFEQWGSLYTSMNLSSDKGTLLLLGAAHSLNHSLFLVLPPLLDEISRDLNASYQAIGVVATIAFLIYGVGALVGGPLSDRIGEVKVISLSIGLSGVATAVFLLPKSMTSFSAGMYLVAALASFYHPTANTLISKHFQENTGGAMGIHGAAGSLGQIFTPLVAFFLGTYFDWRLAFAFFGLITAVTGLLLRRIPAPVRLTGEKVSPLKILTVPNIWIIILYNVFIGLLQRGFELFFPTFLIVNRGFSGEMAALASSAVLLFAVGGHLIGGWITDRASPVRAVILTSAGMVAGMLILLLFPFPTVGVVLFIVVFGVALYGHQPAMTTLTGKVAPRELTGAAYGLMFFFAFGLGSFSTTIIGYIATAFDLEKAFWIMALLSCGTLAVALTLPRVMRRMQSPQITTG